MSSVLLKRTFLACLFTLAIIAGYLATMPDREGRGARFITGDVAPNATRWRERAYGQTPSRMISEKDVDGHGVTPTSLDRQSEIEEGGRPGAARAAAGMARSLDRGGSDEADAASRRLRAQIEVWRADAARTRN